MVSKNYNQKYYFIQGQSLATRQCISTFFFLKFSKSWNNLKSFLLHNGINNKDYDKKLSLGYHDALKISWAPTFVLFCIETIVSNHTVVVFWVKCQKKLKVEVI